MTLNIPYTFNDAQKPLASEINADFAAVKTGVDAANTEIDNFKKVVISVKNYATPVDAFSALDAQGGGSIEFPYSKYNESLSYTEKPYNPIIIEGNNSIIEATNANEYAITIDGYANWRALTINNIHITGATNTKNGILLGNVTTITGRLILNNVDTNYTDFGFRKLRGNEGNIFNGGVSNHDVYGYYAKDSLTAVMHAGCDIIDGRVFNASLSAAIVMCNTVAGGGQFVVRNSIFNFPYGMARMIIGTGLQWSPGVVFEDNHIESPNHYTAGATKPVLYGVDMVTGTNFITPNTDFTYDAGTGASTYVGNWYGDYFADAHIRIKGECLTYQRIVGNSTVTYEDVTLNDISNAEPIVTDSYDASISLKDVTFDRHIDFLIPYKVESVRRFHRDNGITGEATQASQRGAAFFYEPSGVIDATKKSLVSSALYANTDPSYRTPINKSQFFQESGLGLYTNTNMASVPTTYSTSYLTGNTKLLIPRYKYFVYGYSVKKLSDCSDNSLLRLYTYNNKGNNSIGTLKASKMTANKNYHLRGVGYQLSDNDIFSLAYMYSGLATTGGTEFHSYTLGDVWAVPFDTYDEALTFLNSKDLPLPYNMPSTRKAGEYWVSSAPTTGTWSPNSKALNSALATGGVEGWVAPATTYGTFGTLAGVTGDITISTALLTVNDVTNLYEGQYIAVVGMTGTKRISSINRTTKVITLDSVSNANVTGGAVSFVTPTLKTFGIVG